MITPSTRRLPFPSDASLSDRANGDKGPERRVAKGCFALRVPMHSTHSGAAMSVYVTMPQPPWDRESN